jgi:hypothetical protein
VTTQGKKHDANQASEQQWHTPLCTHRDHLKVDEEALEQMNHETEKVQGIRGKLEL